MTDTLKKYLGWVGILGILVVSFALWRFTDIYANSIPVTTARSFTTSGQGKITAVPDVAQFSFSILTEGGKDLAGLQSDNSSKSNKIIDYLKTQSVDAKDIKTSGYSISPRYNNCYSPMSIGTNSSACVQSIIGYSINQSVSVKLRDFKKIGDILSGVVNQGANSISGPNFVIDDPSNLQDQARTLAIQDAEKQAQAIADAGHFRLGRLLSIEEQGSQPPIYYGLGMGVASADIKSVPSPAIEAGSQDVTINVTLRYEIQ